jgi:hypothetical protein
MTWCARHTVVLVVAIGALTCAAGCGKDAETADLVPSTSPKTTKSQPATEQALTATSTTDEGLIDPAKCFRDAGAKTVSSSRDLASVDPSNVTVEAGGTTSTGTHPLAFKNVKGKQFRIYAVGGRNAAASERQVRKSQHRALTHPERFSYVGFLPPPASASAISAGLDCLEGYRSGN